jgi:hypothetical protein
LPVKGRVIEPVEESGMGGWGEQSKWWGRGRGGRRVTSETVSEGCNRGRVSRRMKKVEVGIKLGLTDGKETKPKR